MPNFSFFFYGVGGENEYRYENKNAGSAFPICYDFYYELVFASIELFSKSLSIRGMQTLFVLVQLLTYEDTKRSTLRTRRFSLLFFKIFLLNYLRY